MFPRRGLHPTPPPAGKGVATPSPAGGGLGWGLQRSRIQALPRRARGFTLIDLLVMIVLLGVVAGAMTLLFTRLAVQSSDTLRAREALAVAQALLNEVRMMPFTYCDPQDTKATTATGAFVGGTGCQATVEALGPEPGEGRTVTAVTTPPNARFDNVNDYNNFAQPNAGCAGLCDIGGNLLSGPNSPLQGCRTLVTTTAQSMPGVAALDANGRPQALRITVRVSCPNLNDVVLEGIRMRYAPNRI